MTPTTVRVSACSFTRSYFSKPASEWSRVLTSADSTSDLVKTWISSAPSSSAMAASHDHGGSSRVDSPGMPVTSSTLPVSPLWCPSMTLTWSPGRKYLATSKRPISTLSSMPMLASRTRTSTVSRSLLIVISVPFTPNSSDSSVTITRSPGTSRSAALRLAAISSSSDRPPPAPPAAMAASVTSASAPADRNCRSSSTVRAGPSCSSCLTGTSRTRKPSRYHADLNLTSSGSTHRGALATSWLNSADAACSDMPLSSSACFSVSALNHICGFAFGSRPRSLRSSLRMRSQVRLNLGTHRTTARSPLPLTSSTSARSPAYAGGPRRRTKSPRLMRRMRDVTSTTSTICLAFMGAGVQPYRSRTFSAASLTSPSVNASMYR
mmetsp:Transcript_647/g.1897  ORF Transcript_647/g.1897 Transcript_647/m.1897 type:complete len:379 (+) Transcript_647:546-1682(+)